VVKVASRWWWQLHCEVALCKQEAAALCEQGEVAALCEQKEVVAFVGQKEAAALWEQEVVVFCERRWQRRCGSRRWQCCVRRRRQWRCLSRRRWGIVRAGVVVCVRVGGGSVVERRQCVV